MNPKMIMSAIQTLVRQNQGEIHGDWNSISDRLMCEMGGDPSDEIIKLFEEYLRNLGLEKLTENSPIAFFKGVSGEINFVDRKLIYAVDD